MRAATKYAIGVDFGSESARAVLVRLTDGKEIATSVHPYTHGVIDDVLPETGESLAPDTALQDPEDYLEALERTVHMVVGKAGISSSDVVSLGIDTTACTLVLVDDELAPLSSVPEFAQEPLAYARLWKHHAAQKYADLINEKARDSGAIHLPSYGGAINSEWLLPKALQTFVEAPGVFDAAVHIIEQQDWIVSRLVGKEVRGASVAGYKGTYLVEQGGYPAADFLDELESGFSGVLPKLGSSFLAPGALAGTLTTEWAVRLGLTSATAVAVGNIDAHASVLGVGVVNPNTMVAVMGTSVCNLLVTEDRHEPVGIQGVIKEGILPGKWGYEAGQAGVGDTFGWFVRNLAGSEIGDRATISGQSIFEILESDAAKLAPGESGVLALDWLNGNRSVLVDSSLSGLFVGMTLATRPHHLYRALIEASAFGQRIILEEFRDAGIGVDRIVACGGLPKKSPLLMQTLADITECQIDVSAATNASGVGAALHGALAAGYFPTWEAAAEVAAPISATYHPNLQHKAVYDSLFDLYLRLHDYFGVTNRDIMYELREQRARAILNGQANDSLNS